MTWLDVALIVVLLIFLAVGARLGSLWTAACVTGGFFGAYVVDYYTVPLADMMGGFAGAHALAAALLFAGGCAVAMVPGFLLSRVFAGLMLGVVDSAFGLVTGALGGLLAVSMSLLFIVPMAPRVESLAAWKNSALVRPLHQYLETIFNTPHFRPRALGKTIEKEAAQAIAPAVAGVKKQISALKK